MYEGVCTTFFAVIADKKRAKVILLFKMPTESLGTIVTVCSSYVCQSYSGITVVPNSWYIGWHMPALGDDTVLLTPKKHRHTRKAVNQLVGTLVCSRAAVATAEGKQVRTEQDLSAFPRVLVFLWPCVRHLRS